ncbi:MAG: sulfite exporter TauE/SafE family protein [Planctomycetes bacterium]|nr:sulfite exporter TauE/SafE family protein [Planctomycetota bacterium]
MPDGLAIAELLKWAVVAVAAFAGAFASAITGYGTVLFLMPVLALTMGTSQEAVSVLTLAAILGNVTKGWLNRKDIDWAGVKWYLIGAVPTAALAAWFLTEVPDAVVYALMGMFLLGALIWRWVKKWKRKSAGEDQKPRETMPVKRLAWVGLFTGGLSALVGGAGPVAGPFFLATGMAKGVYVGTEAVASLGVHVVKLTAYGLNDLLTPRVLIVGVALSPLVIAGSWLGKKVLDRLSLKAFEIAVEITLLVAAMVLLWKGFTTPI